MKIPNSIRVSGVEYAVQIKPHALALLAVACVVKGACFYPKLAHIARVASIRADPRLGSTVCAVAFAGARASEYPLNCGVSTVADARGRRKT